MKGIRTIAFLAVLALLVAMPGAPAAGAAPAPTPTPLFKVGIQAGHWPEAGAPSCHDAYSNDPAYKDYTVGETTINHAVRDKVVAILRDVLGPHYQVDALNGDGGKDDVPKNYAADAFLALHCEWCETQNELNAGYKVSRYKGTFAKEGKDGSGDGSDRLVDLVWEHYGPATGLSRDKQSGHYTRNMLEYYGVANLAQGTPGAIIEMGWLYRDYTVLSDASKDGGQDDMARGLANAVLDKEDRRIIFDLASGGFNSTVRLAKSSCSMWHPIFEHNSDYMIESLSVYIRHLENFREAILQGDSQKLKDLILNANRIRPVLEGENPQFRKNEETIIKYYTK